MFADDTVVYSEQMEDIKRWRFALEKRGMNIGCNKTGYLSKKMRLQETEMKKV